MRKPSLSEVRQATIDSGSHFFSRSTMRFFRDTMRSFKVVAEDGQLYLERVRPMRDSRGTDMGGVGDRRIIDANLVVRGKVEGSHRSEKC